MAEERDKNLDPEEQVQNHPEEEQKEPGRRKFLSQAAAAAAGGALILGAAGGEAKAQELPKRKLTLDETTAFARDLALACDIPRATIEPVIATMEQYLKPLVDESGKLAAMDRNIVLTGCISVSST